jgi:hypothetical protein
MVLSEEMISRRGTGCDALPVSYLTVKLPFMKLECGSHWNL